MVDEFPWKNQEIALIVIPTLKTKTLNILQLNNISKNESTYETNFFVSFLGRAFKMMKNSLYFTLF